MNGISPQLHCNLFIFCQDPHSDTITTEKLLEAVRKTKLHLMEQTDNTVSSMLGNPTVNIVHPASTPVAVNPTLSAINHLITMFTEHMQTTEAKFKEQEAQINAIHAIQADNAVRTCDSASWRESPFSGGRFTTWLFCKSPAGHSCQFYNKSPRWHRVLKLWRKEPFCMRLPSCSFKWVEASVDQLTEATGAEKTASSPHCNPNVTNNPNAKPNLLWMKGKIAHQLLDMFLDCGASVPSDLLQLAPHLKQLQQSVYHGPGLIGVNGRPLKVLYTVCAPVVTGNPAISLHVQL